MGRKKALMTSAVSSLLATILVLMGFMPEVAQARSIDRQPSYKYVVSSPRPAGIGINLPALLAATTDLNDTDSDGLPDSVERVLGTDPENEDSDFDKLDDYWEIDNGLDPMNPDSNFDGMPDFLEVTDVSSMDVDGDGFDNAWDSDNDGDGVDDAADLSPFAAVEVNESYHFAITTNGNPFHISFQLIPKNPEHLKLYGQSWDWPDSDKEGAVQDWDNSKQDVMIFPMLRISVNVPPDPDDVMPYSVNVDGNTVWVPLVPVTEYGSIVAFAGKMPYPSSTPHSLTADARLVWRVACKNDPDSDTLEYDTLLATYEDSFVLTGMTISENYGTDAGIFCSPDIDQTVAANLLLAYQFLRNSENHVADMPGVLASNGVDINRQLDSFEHRDAALVAVSNNMTPDALDTLPGGQELPVIAILEDRSTSLDLSELESIGPSSSNFSADLTTEPVMTIKTLKASWYRTSDREAMQTGDVMTAINNLGLSENATHTLMALTLFWNSGEQFVEGLGIPPIEPGDDYTLVSDTAKNITGGSLLALTALYRGGLALEGYRRVKLLYDLGEAFNIDVGGNTKWQKLKNWVNECGEITENSKLWKRMEKCLDGLDVAVLFCEAGFSAYSVVAIAQMSDISGLQVSNALIKTTMQYWFDTSLFAIGLIPYVGWLIAAAVELSDVFGDWSDDFTDWIAEQMTNVEHTVTPGIEIVGENMTVDDWDNNGVDMGDRITFSSSLTGNVTGNEHYWTLVDNSAIYPYYTILPPAGSNSTVGYSYQREVVTDFGNQWLPVTAPQISGNKTEGWKARSYDSSVWIEPGVAMPNFPVYVQINSYYQLWYEWSYFSWSIFNWGWHYHNDWQSGQGEVGHFITYIDTMPENIASFAQWRGIAPLDHDGDGLKDSEEVPGVALVTSTGAGGEAQSDPWLFDTDADGLSDKYEVDIGTDPMKYDSDQDGLLDRYEIQYNCDPNNPDTDGDGLKDSLEVSGWVISFTYGGLPFTERVHSDPAIPDSDGDGVDDATEYWSDLNPRSTDTDGDGVNDSGNSKYLETQLVCEWALNMEQPSGEVLDITMDAEKVIYVLRNEARVPGTSPTEGFDQVYKYDSEGNFVKSWGDFFDWGVTLTELNPVVQKLYLTQSTYIFESDLNGDSPVNQVSDHFFYTIKAIDVDAEGHIFIAEQPGYPFAMTGILEFEPDGTFIKSWGSLGLGPEQFQDIIDIAVDDTSGFIYVVDQRGDDTRIARFTIDGEYLRDMPDGYNHPRAIDVDVEGNLYVANTDNNKILKFNPDGVLLASMGEYGEDEGKLVSPFRIIVDKNDEVYVVDRPGTVPLGRVQKFTQVSGGTRPEIPGDIPDRDGDGLDNDVETNGWDIIYTDLTGSHTIHVASDPLMIDTDLDGLTDLQEHDMGTDPQNPDTDSDGLSDFAEWRGFSPKINPRHFDSDRDGLPDGIEITYGSDPNSVDTDGEGLSDAQEFALGSDPNNTDTDGDGLDDADEKSLNSNPKSADSDGDLLFDGEEVARGTNVNKEDTDNDGLSDGIEVIAFNTDPLNGDSDGDGLNDGKEIELRLDPLSSDTDNDGIPDNAELEQGTNPWMGDSDHDGVPDGVEEDNTVPEVNAGMNTTINEGGTYVSSGSFTDPDTDNWTGGVDYGDGSDIQPLTIAPDKTFALNHTYIDDGNYSVTVTVADDKGGEGSDIIMVGVNNVVPAVNVGPDATVNEGVTFTRSGFFSDAGADSWTATVEYGDGSGVLPLNLNPDKSFVLNHPYSDNGTYTVTVTVMDDDGGIGSDSLLVTVVADPKLQIKILIDGVMRADLDESVKNSLTSKLEVAAKRLADSNTQNDAAVINALQAFINSVEAQRGKKIPEEMADKLIKQAQDIIALINGGI